MKSAMLFFMLLLVGKCCFGQTPTQAEEKTTGVNIPEVELKKFVRAYQEIQLENKKAQPRIVALIEREDLDVERFGEIREALSDPNSTVKVSNSEKVKYEKADAKLRKLRAAFQQKIKSIITDHGLTKKRFDEILNTVQNDTRLQQKVRAGLSGRGN